jgi:hypothetical protein
MSASNNNNPIVLSGDFIEVVNVTDVGTDTESKELIAGTFSEVTFTKENETVEAQLHEQALTVRNRTHYTLDTEFVATVTPNIEALSNAGLVDQNGDPTGQAVWECARFKIYENEPGDQEPPAVFEAYNTEFDFEELTLETGDPGEISFIGQVSGGWHVGSTAPTGSTTTTTATYGGQVMTTSDDTTTDSTTSGDTTTDGSGGSA